MNQEFTTISAVMNAKINSGCKLLSNDGSSNSGSRNVHILEPSVITFENTQWGATVYNDYIVPINIYGIIF